MSYYKSYTTVVKGTSDKHVIYMLETYHRSEIYVLHFTLGQSLRCIVISYLYIDVMHVYICYEEKDKFGGRKGNPGLWTKKLYRQLTWSTLDMLNSLIIL